MFDFSGKNVVVTGGSRGIGAATVELFAASGANVSFNYRADKKSADALMKRIQAYNGNHFCARCEVSGSSDVTDFIGQIIERNKHIDVLVNNAGIWEYGAIDTMEESNWRRTMEVNLDSIFFFTRLVVRNMKEKGIHGRIINVASTAGQRGEAFHSHYAATKGAIISFTKSLASELGPDGILVNCVAPGWVDTDMSKDAIEEDPDKILGLIPIGRIPGPEEIAGPIVFLASDYATAITGEILNVNSGSVLCG
jgi:3-oxoacyl-[acyl-carrier protein] reductase